MSTFFEGALAGYGIAIPVGAIAILIVDMGLRGGFPPGFAAGAGAASADLLYALLAVLAGAALAPALAPYAPGLRLVSGLALLAFGGHGLWKVLQVNGRGEDAQPAEDPRGLAGVYTRFLGLTLLNPLTIAYFGALILGRDAAAAATTLDRALFVVGAGLASLSWQTLLAGLGALGNRRLSPGFRRGASIGGNLVVIALGVRILVFASQ